jgi:predicted MPP superfamily phosphohydrolase
LRGAGGLSASTVGLGSYAFGAEPNWRLGTTRYALTPPRWPATLALKVAVIADIHACRPMMGPERIRDIVALANAGKPDLTLILGDFNGAHRFVTGPVWPEEWAAELALLRAPLGVFAVLGNHDFWHGPLPNLRGDDGESIRAALKSANIRLLENAARRIETPNGSFWIAGLGDQMVYHRARGVFTGIDDLPGTLRQVTDDAPVLLMAHEPYAFRHMDPRVSLTLCGHTHGGQVYIPGFGAPAIAMRHDGDYVYGHIVDRGQHMIISGGLGTSILPVRFMRPPEVVELRLGGVAEGA